uniref:PKHD1 ciliary IPT domain containing fibrocystin/polyductin n=1 Tax=Leptobrachium leishanense TaxID=445787 RepID=A0A8C5MPS6_9ANUR
MRKDSWRISAKQELFVLQTHSEIQSISPDSGSTEGGTDITIHGNFFQQPAKVTVAGDPCTIKSISPKAIVCRTGPQSRRQTSSYAGNRGLLFEVWAESMDVNLTDKSNGYKSSWVASASSPAGTVFETERDFSARLSGFFVAPETNNYTFWIEASSEAQLYFSQSEDEEGKILTLSGSGEIRFCWGNATTNLIPINATASHMQKVLEDMLSVHCIVDMSFADIFLHNGFEKGMNDTGTDGRLASWTEPYCGRISAFKPTFLLKASQSIRYELRKYKHLCFAYKGYIADTLMISVSYNITNQNTIKINSTCQWPVNEGNPERWKFGCVDLWNCSKMNDSLQESTKSSVFVDQIWLQTVKNSEESKSWFYVDDIVVSDRSIQVFQVDPMTARPGGHILESVSIAGSYPTYNLTSLVANCGIGLPLIELCGGPTILGSADGSELRQSLESGNETIELKVQRVQSASPPIGGTFIIRLSDGDVTGIPVNISASRLKETLITHADNNTAQYIKARDFTVTKDLNTCNQIVWTLTWTNRTGDLPNFLHVYAENLTGLAPSVRARIIYDGGILIWPIFGDMLATANALPQVTVHVNDIPANCSGNCSFQHLPELTSQVKEIQYSGGDGCDGEVSIAGSGFGENGKDINVQINDTNCSVVHANKTCLLCCLDTFLSLCEHRVLIHVKHQGFAANSTGKYISLQVVPSLSRVIPAVISQIGGHLVVLRGIGFGDTNLVYFGSEECQVNSSNSTTVECIAPTQRHNAEVDVTVKIGNQRFVFTNLIKYDPSINPVIMSLTPNVSSVAGDRVIFINMSRFENTTNMDIIIMVGNTTATLKRLTASGIEFSLPEIPPGLYNVCLTINGIVIATDGFEPTVQFVLNTFMVEPCCGSFAGGTIVTIFGNGFISNISSISVFVAEQLCFVLASTQETITCRTPPSPSPSSDLEEMPATITVRIANYTAIFLDSGQHNRSVLLFMYQKDFTPVVSNISWLVGEETLWLSVFGSQLTNSLILFESPHRKLVYKLNDTESNSSSLETSLEDFEAGIYHITVYNQTLGYAHIISPQNPVFNLDPLVRSISPPQGSLCGGTILTISGTFLHSSINSVAVNLTSDYICDVQSFDNSTIECALQNDDTRNISSHISINVSVVVNGLLGVCQTDCVLHLVANQTPIVNDFITTFGRNLSIFQFMGWRLENASETLTILVDRSMLCGITFVNKTIVECQMTAIPPGNHSITIPNVAKGEMCSSNILFNFSITPQITNMSRLHFSIHGGGLLEIQGSALLGQRTTDVFIGYKQCLIIALSYESITCVVPPGNGILNVTVVVDNLDVMGEAVEFSERYTPKVHSSWKDNNILSLMVSGVTALENIQIFVGDAKCENVTGNTSALQCLVPPLVTGRYQVKIIDRLRGWASSNATVITPLRVLAMKNNTGCAENQTLYIYGEGFSPKNTHITICGTPCVIIENVTTTTDLYCSSWRLNSSLVFLCDMTYGTGESCHVNSSTYIQCDVTVQVGRIQVTEPSAYLHVCNMKCIAGPDPEDNILRDISGLFISPKVERDEVLIYNGSCNVSIATEAEMECEAPNQPITSKITEIRKNWGQNTQSMPPLRFCSLWSKNSTWPFGSPPLDGDNVTVEFGRTLLLDTDTSVLNLLHVKGGRLIIMASGPVHLQAHYIIVSDGGKLQVGTPSDPYSGKAQITLHGSSHTSYFDPFGVKFLAVRNGALSMHGWVPKLMFTHLAESADAQGTELTLEEPVDWHIGDEIVICGVGFQGDRMQEEVSTIEKIDNTEISISPPLRNTYKVVEQLVDGQVLSLKPIIALLSRNIVIRGNLTNSYIERSEQCSQARIPDILNCLYGRSEKKLGSRELGAILMTQALSNEKTLLRISGVQFLNMGQAFKKHQSALNVVGDTRLSGSYIKGCSIINSFSRGLIVSGISGFKVEGNTFYNIRGHGLLVGEHLEDGIAVKHNLLIRVRGTDALSNNEMLAPAAVYIRTPSNNIENNIVWNAGYGFFYHLSRDGPSSAPLRSFKENMAVSCLRSGFWLYPEYRPPNNNAKAVFQGFSAWRSGGGTQVARCGNVAFKEFKIYSCVDFGMDVAESTGNTEISDSLLLGHLDAETGCMKTGIKTPKRFQALLSNITFMNFDRTVCSAMEACSGCSIGQGGFTVKTQQIKFLNSPRQFIFPFPHSAVIEDLDGSFSGLNGSQLVPSVAILPDSCSENVNISGAVPGSVCAGDVVFHRMSIGFESTQDTGFNLNVTNSLNRTMTLSYVHDTLSNQSGWMALLVDKDTYTITFDSAYTNDTLNYSATFDNFKLGDYILIEHKDLPSFEDLNITCESQMGQTPPYLNLPGYSRPCDWIHNTSLRSVTYLVTGENRVRVTLTAGGAAAVPTAVPSALPHSVLKWSFPVSWEGVGEGWGGYNGSIPRDGDDVIILPNRTILVDTILPPLKGLYVLGTLVFPLNSSNVLNASCILIAGGELRIGTAKFPLQRDQKLQIILRTSEKTGCDRLSGLNVSSGVIGVFGKLQIHSPYPRRSWTHLGADVAPGNEMIVVTDTVDWKAGDHVVISSSSYEAHHAEFVQIQEVYGDIIKLRQNLLYRHTGASDGFEDTRKVPQSAEVGLLSHNVRIMADVPCSGTIIVGDYSDGKDNKYLGTLQLSNVEISHFGSSAYSTINLNTSLPSSMTSLSIHHSCGGGISAVVSKDILLYDNVIYNVVGHGIHLEGQNHNLTNNLLVLVRQSEGQAEWVTGIKTNRAMDVYLSGNVVAGSERIGFHVKGRKCSPEENHSPGNVVHSSLHGLHFYWGDGFQNCTKISGFLSYKNYDYGLVFHLEGSVEIENVSLLDNSVGILPVVSQKLFKYARNYMSIKNSLIVATSHRFDCTMDRITPLSARATTRDRAPRSPLRGRVGILWPIFTEKPKLWPTYPWHMLGRDGAVSGLMKLQDVEFSGFVTSCYSDDIDVCIMSNPQSPGIMAPITAERTSMVNGKYENIFYFHSIERDPECPVSLECYGSEKALFKDLDGVSLGLALPPITVFPESDLHISQSCHNLGVYRKENLCSYKSDFKGHVCQQIDHTVVVLENIGDATEYVAPVLSVTENFIDMFVNGNISQDRCCSENVHSTFYSMLPANKITKVCFNGPTPKNLRLRLNGGQNTTKLILALFYDTPQTVSILSRESLIVPVSYDTKLDFFNEMHTSASFSFTENLLYVLLQGDEPIVISTNPSLLLAFYVLKGTSSEIRNQFTSRLADYLGIGNGQVAILQTLQGDMGTLRTATDNHAKRKLQCPSIADEMGNNGKKRVRRSSGGNVKTETPTGDNQNNLEVILVEIGNRPIPGTDDSSYLTSEKLQSIETLIIGSLQTGELDRVLPTQIDSLMIVDSELSRLGNNTRDSNEFKNDVIVYVRPHSIHIDVQPLGGIAGKPFATQPNVTFLDKKGNRVENLGYPSIHWQLLAYLKDSSSTALKGNTTVVIKDGWGNFSNLAISSSGSSWCLVFNVTSPPGVTFTAQSEEFKVLPEPARDKEYIFMLVVLSSAVSATALFMFFCCFFKRKRAERLKNGKISK